MDSDTENELLEWTNMECQDLLLLDAADDILDVWTCRVLTFIEVAAIILQFLIGSKIDCDIKLISFNFVLLKLSQCLVV